MIQDGSWLLPINCIQTCKEKTNKYKGDFKPICSSNDTIHICTLGYNWMWNWDLVFCKTHICLELLDYWERLKQLSPTKKCVSSYEETHFLCTAILLSSTHEKALKRILIERGISAFIYRSSDQVHWTVGVAVGRLVVAVWLSTHTLGVDLFDYQYLYQTVLILYYI